MKGYEMSTIKFKQFLKKPWEYKYTDSQTKTSCIRKGSHKYGHGLTLVNGHLYCNLCDTPVGKKFGQHLGGKIHTNRFEAKKAEEAAKALAEKQAQVTASVNENETSTQAFERLTNEVIDDLEQDRQVHNLAGTSLSRAQTQYRIKVLEYLYLANMSSGQLSRFKGALDLKGSPSLTVGNAPDLPRLVGAALRKAQEKKLKWVMENCHPLYSTVSDGSPLGANAEAIIVRMIRQSDNKIVEVLISLRLFEGKLSGEYIANNLLAELRRYDLDPKKWRGSMMDRASTNSKAIEEIKRVTVYKPGFFPCFSHVFSAPGKEFKSQCKELHQFRLAYNSSIMFRGKLYQEVKKLLGGVAPVIAGGVRWYLEWEQIDQMDKFGIDRLVDVLVPYAESKKLSQNSVRKMKTRGSKYLLPKVIVQAAAIAEVGREFCIATYLTEGNDPLALGVYRVFQKLDNHVTLRQQFDGDSRTKQKCKYAAKLVADLREDKLENVSIAETDVATTEEEISALDVRIQHAVNEVEAVQRRDEERQSRSRRARTSARDYNAYAGNRTTSRADIERRIAILREEKDALEESLDTAKENKLFYERKLNELDDKLGPITEQDFVRYAKTVTNIAFEKYEKLFENDELKRVRKAFRACEVFDILALKDGQNLNTNTLRRMIDDLKFFEFKEFDDAFLDGMKQELNDLLDLVGTMEFDFESECNESELYTNRVLSRARRARQRAILSLIQTRMNENNAIDGENNENDLYINMEEELRAAENDIREIKDGDYRNMNWKNDPGERARRIYEWWRTVMNEKTGQLPFFTKAVRIVCLIQPSSAAAERVFSQLTFIRRIIGDAILEDGLECRGLIRCNNGLADDFEV